MGEGQGIGAQTLRRFRDYAVAEPSYTIAFAAWETGLSLDVCRLATEELLRLGIVEQVEPRSGPYGAVYAYKEITAGVTQLGRKGTVTRLFPELDASHAERVAIDAPVRGRPVPHTGTAVGPSGRPGRDKAKQAAGFRVKRARQGT